MRLSPTEVIAIKRTIRDIDPEAIITLFGSRCDDNKKGGDIDLFVQSQKISVEDKLKIKIKLYDKIGEQRIDLIVAEKPNTAFLQMVAKEGILL